MYPLEVIPNQYLTKLGGFSHELDRYEVGINEVAIRGTSLIPGETLVRLRVLGCNKVPFFFRRRFRVVGIKPGMSCYHLTLNGELVMSEDMRDEFGRFLGKEVIINAVESVCFGGLGGGRRRLSGWP